MKLAKLTLLFLVAFSLSLLSAKGWEVDSDILINLTQGIYSDNWSGSEQSTVTWVAQSNTTAQKQMKEWLNNKNTLKLAFGQTHQEKGDIDGDGEVEWGSGQNPPTRSTSNPCSDSPSNHSWTPTWRSGWNHSLWMKAEPRNTM